MNGPATLGGPWTADNPLPVTQVAGAPPNVQGYYPPTVDNPLPVYIVSGAVGATQTPEPSGIGEPPDDGRVYARKHGAWVPIGVQD
jgi:hypothetical protein